MSFTIDQLPYRDLQALGLSRKDVISLPPRTLNALLSGHRTSLMRFHEAQLGSTGERLVLDAKLSLSPDQSGNPQLRIHPILQKSVNHFGLTDQEMNSLENGEPFIEKKYRSIDGSLSNILVSKDAMTNEYIAVQRDKINPPEEINGVKLNDEQKEDFKNGNEVHIGNQAFRLDPTSEIGISDAKTGSTKDIKKIKFAHSSYSNQEIMVDVVLLTSGVGAFVLMEHLADLAGNSKIQKKSNGEQFNRQTFTTALAEAATDIKEKAKEHNLDPDAIGNIVNAHLQEHGIKISIDKREVSGINEDKILKKKAKQRKLKM